MFDANFRLLDWNSGFVEEFADAAAILAPGISVNQICQACLLPERALDFSWVCNANYVNNFDYINNKQAFSVSQELTANGCIVRIAQHSSQLPKIHPNMPDSATELLRSSALQISATVTRQREQQTSYLNALAHTDGLTGTPNRRFFNTQLEKEWERCKLTHAPLSLIFIDIDFFKHYNDFYGHTQGDECLKTVAQTLMSKLNRSRDMIARYGGEEFVCLLPETDLAGATQKAQELELAVRTLAMAHIASETMPILTISLGVATIAQVTGDDSAKLVVAADRLLYEAKANGRACVRAGYG